MRRQSLFSLALLLVSAGGFAFGLFYLFKLRFEIGDIYPPYSSLRSDPLGTMALCESLEKIPGVSVRRDFSAGERLPEERGTTYLHLAARQEEWRWLSRDLAAEITRFVVQGGRLTVTFFPETDLTSFSRRSGSRTNVPPGLRKASPKKRAAGKGLPMPEEVRIEDQLGVGFRFSPLVRDDAGNYQPASVVNKSDLPLPEEIEWHSGMVFTNLDKAWQTIYAHRADPVLIERKLGSGSIVMATDSYFLSNEALVKDRQVELLAWLIGRGKHVVFDEAHFGIVESPGVAGLMRKYRLHGLGLGLLVLAGLFIWKNSSAFVPPPPEEACPASATGREASAGLVNLLRRNVAPKDLLNVCFGEWTKSLLHGGAQSIARVDQAQAIVETENAKTFGAHNPLRAYQEICRTLKLAQPGSAASAETKTAQAGRRSDARDSGLRASKEAPEQPKTIKL